MISSVQLLKSAVQSYPKHSAIIDEYGVMSYQMLYQQVEELKDELLAAGLSQGMGLGVMGRNGRAFIISMFAGMACDAVVIPISHQLKAAEINTLLKDTKLHAVLDDQSGVTPILGDAVFIPVCAQSLRLAWTDISSLKTITPLKDAAFIRYTSGTTGTSKGVVLTHASILQRVDLAHQSLQMNADDKVLWVLPMAFHFIVTILVYVQAGASIIICQDILAQTLIKQANLYQATMLYAAPMHFRLLAADTSAEQLNSLKYVISTSSAIPVNIADGFKQRFNIPIIQAYGIIEAGLPLLDSVKNSNPRTVGFPSSGFKIALLDENDHQVDDGVTGRLAIQGEGMFDAYLSPWQLAKEVMSNNWFMTGDLAQRQMDGRIIICGREKSMINISGNKAFPEEIEAVLNSHADIIDSHVFGQTHPFMGEIVCAEVIMKENIRLDVEVILQFCRILLSTYKVPQRLHAVTEFNLTPSGKVKRNN